MGYVRRVGKSKLNQNSELESAGYKGREGFRIASVELCGLSDLGQ